MSEFDKWFQPDLLEVLNRIANALEKLVEQKRGEGC